MVSFLPLRIISLPCSHSPNAVNTGIGSKGELSQEPRNSQPKVGTPKKPKATINKEGIPDVLLGAIGEKLVKQ